MTMGRMPSAGWSSVWTGWDRANLVEGGVFGGLAGDEWVFQSTAGHALGQVSRSCLAIARHTEWGTAVAVLAPLGRQAASRPCEEELVLA